jgi:hypothetical protein
MLSDFNTVSKMIESGKPLFLAGDEGLLGRLPKGQWIGGTIPYFMGEEGGVTSRDRIFATEVPAAATGVKAAWYDESTLSRIVSDAPDNGFTFVIIPSTSAAHIAYARNAPDFKDIFMKPIIGWIAGTHLDDIGTALPKVFSGATGEASHANAIAMHVSLPVGKQASIGIINPFRQGKGDEISFDDDGFSVSECRVGGKRVNFAEYIAAKKIDTRLPLVADYNGAMVNVSIQAIDEKNKIVSLYAPVFKDVLYRVADPIDDYVKEFSESVAGNSLKPVFSCNCILNYLYASLEGKKTGTVTGPITFGEIAYQLLNQTLVYLDIADTGA